MAVPTANASVVQVEIRQAAVQRTLSGMFQHVANATNSVDQGTHSFAIDLAAQAVNVDIHHVGCGIDSHTPHVVQNHAASHDTAGIATQIFQERELLWSELQYLIATSRFTPHQIELQVSGLEANWFALRA